MTNFESFTVIPSRKNSMFEETNISVSERYNITDNYEEWLNAITPALEPNSRVGELTQECKDFAKQFKRYMVGPIAKYGQEIILAKSKVVNSLNDINDFDNQVLYLLLESHSIKEYPNGRYIYRYGDLSEVS